MTKKNKQYEHDYEWSGNAGPVKGVNLAEKNPWNKPGWNAVTKPQSPAPASHDSRKMEQKPTDWQRLQSQHQWQTPEWATMKNKQTNNAIVKDPVPKPMLKKREVGTTKFGGATAGGTNTRVSEEEAEIAEMERLIEEAKQKKAALERQKKEEEERKKKEEEERQKNSVNETALEKARREAKEREEARWRATLAERNVRDKERREQARLAALSQQSKLHDVTSWQTQTKTKETSPRSSHNHPVNIAAVAPSSNVVEPPVQLPQPGTSAVTAAMTTQQHKHHEPAADRKPVPQAAADEAEDYEEVVEYVEEYVDDYEEEEIVEEEYEEQGEAAADAAELQRQIDALRQQLAAVQK